MPDKIRMAREGSGNGRAGKQESTLVGGDYVAEENPIWNSGTQEQTGRKTSGPETALS
jgi:hypothetical protein